MNIIELPPIKETEPISFEKLLTKRKSIRRFKDEPLTLQQLSNILWFTYGTTIDQRRVVPSAGAIYPFTIFVSIKNVQEVNPGLYTYNPQQHTIQLSKDNPLTEEIANSCIGKGRHIRSAPLTIILVADYSIITMEYGERGILYTYQESGHIGQNIYLGVIQLGLSTVAVGAFYPKKLSKVLNIKKANIEPLYIFPIGKALM